ncbi:MAG: WYL domain-containing protein [Candidatus Aureabacteria bacterium]|nr:WYL domain-containing protein [Candidatus Auribacterota bacterium]
MIAGLAGKKFKQSGKAKSPMLPRREFDKKIRRIVTILNKLETKKVVKTSELAAEFNVSLRTIQRDINLIDTTGFPLKQEAERGCYTFMDNFSLKQIMLSREEASLLSFLHGISKVLGKKFDDSFSSIFKRVISSESSSPFYVKLPEGERLSEDYPFLENLKSAINDEIKVKIEYSSGKETKEYEASPVKIAFYEGLWYLLAYVRAGELMKFRLDFISRVTLLDEYFEMPQNLKTMLDESVNIWFTEKRDKKVTFKVDEEAAKYFRYGKYFPLQKVRLEKDGTAFIETKVGIYEEIIPAMLSWISHISEIEPAELKEKLIGILKSAISGI